MNPRQRERQATEQRLRWQIAALAEDPVRRAKRHRHEAALIRKLRANPGSVIREERGVMTWIPPAVSAAAIHEAAHALVARRWGCNVRGVFVRDSERGITYFDAPASRFEGGRLIDDPLGRIRALAAVGMSGVIAERLLAGEPVPDAEALLRAESNDEIEQLFRASCAAFTSKRDRTAAGLRRATHNGSQWLKAMLTGTRRQVIATLRAEWPEVLQRAHDLDTKARDHQRRAAA